MRIHLKLILFVVIAILALIVIFILYFFFNVIFSSGQHRSVSSQTAELFQPEYCYNDNVSTERVLCIDDNENALLWRLRVIETAQEEIILSTFNLRADNSGCDIMSALFCAAERGVNIRILVDGLRRSLTKSSEFAALISHPNVEAKFYNPINLIKPWRATFRLHDKYLIADNSVYILGGRNNNDLFLGQYTSTFNVDRDLLVYETNSFKEDTSMAQIRRYFETMWARSCNRSIHCKSTETEIEKAKNFLAFHYQEIQKKYPSAFEQTDYFSSTMDVNKIMLLSNPQEPVVREPTLWYMLKQLMMNQDEVLIQTPYIVCSDDMYRDLTDISTSSQNIAIITNAVESGANPWGCSDYLNQKDRIRKTGVILYEYLGQNSNHSKAVLINDRISIIGSFNLDMRSTYLDTELMLVVDCQELNRQIRQGLEEKITQSKKIYPDGSCEYGSQYSLIEMPREKKFLYSVLKKITKPIRCML